MQNAYTNAASESNYSSCPVCCSFQLWSTTDDEYGPPPCPVWAVLARLLCGFVRRGSQASFRVTLFQGAPMQQRERERYSTAPEYVRVVQYLRQELRLFMPATN